MKIWRMRIACWMLKATNTHSEYVILMLSHCDNGTLSVFFIYNRIIVYISVTRSRNPFCHINTTVKISLCTVELRQTPSTIQELKALLYKRNIAFTE